MRDVRDMSPKRALPPFATGGKTPFYTLRNQMSHIVQSFATGDKTICHWWQNRLPLMAKPFATYGKSFKIMK